MDSIEYNRLSTAQHGPWILPDFFFDEEGNVDTVGALILLEEQELITYNENGFIVVTDELRDTMPTVHEWLEMIIRDAQQASLDEMVDKGFLSFGIDEDGNPSYRPTELGEGLV